MSSDIYNDVYIRWKPGFDKFGDLAIPTGSFAIYVMELSKPSGKFAFSRTIN